jgi:hypothetical protein
MNWWAVPGVRPSGPATGEAAIRNATTAAAAIRTRFLASRCGQPTGVTVNSASSMPATNQDRNAGGQFTALTPTGVSIGISAQPRLSTPAAASTGMRARTGTRRTSSANTGSAR